MDDSPHQPLRVFLCHSSGDKPTVRELYHKLNGEDWIDVWLDEKKLLPGQEWEDEIEKALDNSDAVIVTLSTGSVSKEGYIQKELKYVLDIALEKPEGTIFILPLRLNDCERPRSLKRLHFVDYFPQNARDQTYMLLLTSLRNRAKALGIVTGKTDANHLTSRRASESALEPGPKSRTQDQRQTHSDLASDENLNQLLATLRFWKNRVEMEKMFGPLTQHTKDEVEEFLANLTPHLGTLIFNEKVNRLLSMLKYMIRPDSL